MFSLQRTSALHNITKTVYYIYLAKAIILLDSKAAERSNGGDRKTEFS